MITNFAIREACRNRHFKIARYLVKKGAPETLLSGECRDYIRRNETQWSRLSHPNFSTSTNKLFGTLFLSIQRMEDIGMLALAPQAMFEEMLEMWSGADD
jgi:hypothetical protein